MFKVMFYIIAWAVFNYCFGMIFCYFFRFRKNERCGVVESIGLASIGCCVFLPVYLYLLRWFQLDNGIGGYLVFVFVVVLLIIEIKHGKKIKDYFYWDIENFWQIALIFGIFAMLWFVNEGLIFGHAYYNRIFDFRKSYGMLLSAINSNGLNCEHPFATGYNMIYYMFYYFKVGEVFKMFGNHCPYGTFPALFMMDQIQITLAIICIFNLIAKERKIHSEYLKWIGLSLVLDGGLDCIYYFTNGNQVPDFGRGFIDDWIRNVFDGYSPGAHSNYITKVIWQPQHVSATVCFLFIMFIIIKCGNKLKLREHIFCGICLISCLGYSVTVAMPVYLSIGIILFINLLRNKKEWKNYAVYLMAAISAIPMLFLYMNNGASSTVHIRTAGDYIGAFKASPVWFLTAGFVEFGTVAFVVCFVLIYAFRKKKDNILNICIFITTIMALFNALVYMTGVNDVGMQSMFALYMSMYVLCISVDFSKCMYKIVVYSGIFVFMIFGTITTLKSLALHTSINIADGGSFAPDTLYLAEWMCDNTTYDESSIVVSDLPEHVYDTNCYIPMLCHNKTFWAQTEGTQYLNQEGADEINEFWIQFYNVWTPKEKIDYYKDIGINYFIVAKEDCKYTKKELTDAKLLYENDTYEVYKYQ